MTKPNYEGELIHYGPITKQRDEDFPLAPSRTDWLNNLDWSKLVDFYRKLAAKPHKKILINRGRFNHEEVIE